MIINVPFVYTVSVVRGRKQKPEKVDVLGSVAVSILETTSDEAVPAIRYAEADDKGRAKTTELRVFNDKLYSAYRDDDEGHADGPWLKAMSESLVDGGCPLISMDDKRTVENGEAVEKSSFEQDVREWRSTNETTRAGRVIAQAASLILVDGMLWEKTREPMLRLVTGRHSRDGKPGIEIVYATYVASATCLYRLDEAHMIAPSSPEVFVDVEPADGVIPEIEVLVPESLSYPATELAILEFGVKLATNMIQNLELAAADYLVAYAALRDSVNTMKGDADEDGVRRRDVEKGSSELESLADAVIDALPPVRDAIKRSPGGRYHLDSWLPRIDGIIERHRLLRERDLEDSLSESFGPAC